MTRSVQTLLALNVAMLFLQWAVVSDADAFAVLGFQAGSLQRTLWSALMLPLSAPQHELSPTAIGLLGLSDAAGAFAA